MKVFVRTSRGVMLAFKIRENHGQTLVKRYQRFFNVKSANVYHNFRQAQTAPLA